MNLSLRRPTWTLKSAVSLLQALQGDPPHSYINCVNAYPGRSLTYHADKLLVFIGLSRGTLVEARTWHAPAVPGVGLTVGA